MWTKERSVLHVDDDPQTQQALRESLSSVDYQLVTQRDPFDTLNRIAQDQYRVVLLDIDMSGVDGLDLLRQIKSFDGGIQVLVLTEVVSHRTLLQIQRYGATACFFKPLVNVAPLADALDEAFRGLDRWSATFADLKNRRMANAPAFHSAALTADNAAENESRMSGAPL